MKKQFIIFTQIFVFCILLGSLSLSAQKHIDFALTIANPENNTVIPFGDTVHINFWLKNLGAIALDSTDTFFYRIEDQQGAYVNMVDYGKYISAGDSILIIGVTDLNQQPQDKSVTLCFWMEKNENASFSNLIDTNPTNDTACVTYTMKGSNSTRIHSLSKKQKTGFEIFPNPAQQQAVLFFELPRTQKIWVVMTNVLGKKVRQIKYGQLSEGKQSLNLNISGLNAGTYFVTLKGNRFRKTQNLIIK